MKARSEHREREKKLDYRTGRQKRHQAGGRFMSRNKITMCAQCGYDMTPENEFLGTWVRFFFWFAFFGVRGYVDSLVCLHFWGVRGYVDRL